MAIKVDALGAAVADLLEEYGDGVRRAVNAGVNDAAAVCVETLEELSPKRTGNYARGWRKKKVTQTDTEVVVHVHNAHAPWLTHLLERGHANVDGGRTQAYPHIQPAADKAARLLEKAVKYKVEDE